MAEEVRRINPYVRILIFGLIVLVAGMVLGRWLGLKHKIASLPPGWHKVGKYHVRVSDSGVREIYIMDPYSGRLEER